MKTIMSAAQVIKKKHIFLGAKLLFKCLYLPFSSTFFVHYLPPLRLLPNPNSQIAKLIIVIFFLT